MDNNESKTVQEVKIVAIDISVLSLANFIIKWLFATIIAGIVMVPISLIIAVVVAVVLGR